MEELAEAAVSAHECGDMTSAVRFLVTAAKEARRLCVPLGHLQAFDDICTAHMKMSILDLSPERQKEFAKILQRLSGIRMRREARARSRAARPPPAVIRVSDAAAYLAKKLPLHADDLATPQDDKVEIARLRRSRVQVLLFYAEAVHFHLMKRPLFREKPRAKELGPAYLEACQTLLTCIPDDTTAATDATDHAQTNTQDPSLDCSTDMARCVDVSQWHPRIGILLDMVHDVLEEKTTEELSRLSRIEPAWLVCCKREAVIDTALMAHAYATKDLMHNSVVNAIVERLYSIEPSGVRT